MVDRARRVGRLALVGALAAVVGGCGGGGGGSTPAADPQGGRIEITNFRYQPSPTQVTLGQTVTVTNRDRAPHTLTVPGGIDSGELTEGETFSFTPATAGTISYLCDIHQYMKGQIVVS